MGGRKSTLVTVTPTVIATDTTSQTPPMKTVDMTGIIALGIILVAIIGRALKAITDEMSISMEKTTRSPPAPRSGSRSAGRARTTPAR